MKQSLFSFYKDLKPFTKFEDLVDPLHFSDLPSDWSVIITDVKGSTKAIAEGRYKEVNTIGAAAIVVSRKALGNQDFPFVFGGDGATLLIPDSLVPAVCENLSALKDLAIKTHALDLRVGIVSNKNLREMGKSIGVARFEVTPGRSIAILRGEGITYAEKLVKENPEEHESKLISTKEADLSGLSCRWNPIPSRKGKILSILVSSRVGTPAYEEFLLKLNNILPEGIEGSNPTNVELATYKSFWKLIQEESRLHEKWFSGALFKRVIEIFVAVLVFKYGIPPLIFDPKAYSKSMRTHSDFRKFDDVLRMVIDCSPSDISAIKDLLQSLYNEGAIFYGIFETDNSLMTCFVDGLNQGEHIHFIDAENGGYASAAIGLKEQIKKHSKV